MELKAQQYLKRTAEEANPATDDSSSCNNKSNRPTTKRRLNSISPLKRNVRFADPCEQQVCRKDLFAGLTNEEYYLLCSQMWYTRKDYDDFLRDRVGTIRVWRSMGGNLNDDLREHYCLRGLEPYQSTSLNAEMHSHRCMHHKAILREQRRQERSGVPDPCRMHASVSHMSAWALQRAQRLGALDTRDAATGQDSASNSLYSHRRFSMHTTTTPTVSSSSTTTFTTTNTNPRNARSTTMPRRASMPALFQHQQQRQGGVNVDQLKAWNVKLLQNLMADQQTAKQNAAVVELADAPLSLRTLLAAAPPTQRSNKRAPDFLTEAAADIASSSSGGNNSSVGLQMERLPYQVIRRDSLSCHKSHQSS